MSVPTTTTTTTPPTRLRLDELPLGRTATVDTAAGAYLVTRTSAGITALPATCTHAAGPLEVADDGCLRCPWHGAVFDATTGAVQRGPARRSLPPVPVRVADGIVELAPGGHPHATAPR